MAIIKVLGTKQGEKIYLARTRKATDETGNRLPQKQGEVPFTNSNGEVTEYRKKIDSNLPDFKIHKINRFEFTNKEGKITGYRFSLIVSKDSKVHIIDLGENMVAKSILNSLCSLVAGSTTKEGAYVEPVSDEAITSSTYSLSVYFSKTGYNSAWLTRNGEVMGWAMSPGEQKELIKVYKDDTGAVIKVDDSAYVDRLWVYIQELNKKFPRAESTEGKSGFDDLDDEENTAPVQSVQEAADELFGPDEVAPNDLDVPFSEGL